MSPHAAVVDCESIDYIQDIGGIEVEHVLLPGEGSSATKIWALPSESVIDEERMNLTSLGSMRVGIPSLAYSFDSVDEIDEFSHEARMIKTIAQKAITTADDAPLPHETEAQYLEVLDRHIEATDPEMVSFGDLEGDLDDVHPHKNQARVDEILEHLLESHCCQCNSAPPPRVLRSSLKSPKWSDPAMYHNSATTNESKSNHSVSFQNVDIQEYRITLGDHPNGEYFDGISRIHLDILSNLIRSFTSVLGTSS